MQIETENCGQITYAENEHFTKKLNGKILVTTRHGSWDLLENEEYEFLRKRKLGENSSLFTRLENTGIILTEKNIQKVIKRFSQQYSFLSSEKMLCILSLNRTCNLNCTYCHAESVPFDVKNKDKKMARETMERVLEFLYSAPFQHIGIQFQGGEPLIQFEEIKYFLERLYSTAPKYKKIIDIVEIVTNLTMMNEDIAKYIIEKEICLCTSLDGPKELHDEQRKYMDGKGSYDNLIRWIKYFQKKGKRFNLIPTMTSNSLKCGAKKIIDEYVKWNCKSILFKPVAKIGRAKEINLCVSAEEFFNFWKEGIEYLIELNKRGIRIYDRYAQGLLRNVLLPYKLYMCTRRPCGAGISQLAFAENGDIHACDLGRSMHQTAVGNVYKDTFCQTVFKTMDLRTFSQDFQPLCNSCVFNAYCPTCISRNQSVHKDILPHKPNDFNCRLTKLALSYIFERMQCSEYKETFTKWAWLND